MQGQAVATVDFFSVVAVFKIHMVTLGFMLNEIGRVSLEVSVPLVFDDYATNRITGSFILTSETTNATVAAGMIGRPRFPFNLNSG